MILKSSNETLIFMMLQEKLDSSPKKDVEGMGVPEIKYGDSLCFIMHMATGLWLSYQAPDVKSTRLGPLKRRVSYLCILYIYRDLARMVNLHYYIVSTFYLIRCDDVASRYKFSFSYLLVIT